MSFISLLKKHYGGLLLTLVCILLANAFSLTVPWGIKTIIDNPHPAGKELFLGRIVALLALALGFKIIVTLIQRHTSNTIGEKVIAELRSTLFNHIQRMPITRIQTTTPSQLLSRMTSDVDAVRRFVFGEAIESIYAVVSITGISVLLVFINWQMTLAALITLPVFIIAYWRHIPRLKNGYTHGREALGQMTSRLSEVLNGISTVRAFNAQNTEQALFEKAQGDIFRLSQRTQRLNTSMWAGIELFTSIGFIGVLWIGGNDVLNGRMTPGALIAFYSYLGMLFAPLIRIIIINSSCQEAAAALKRVNDILSSKNDAFVPSVPAITLPRCHRICLENVSFSYPSGKRALNNISLTINAGETIGIIGPSGAGKSTLIGLLLRFFDPDQGCLRINGHDLRSLDIMHYRSRTAVVLQDDFLFNDSIASNISYGVPGAARQAVIDAASAAQAHEFIMQLPQDYDTKAGERGTGLSCGQRQRVAIARALLKHPDILILDEATSAVDAMMENMIQQAIKSRLHDKTVLLVAHRFSTIMEADRVIVLENGCVAGIGTHQELLQNCAFYRQLYNEQFKTTLHANKE
jgi:subfamily B ATP-binding cassette protein MsbA